MSEISRRNFWALRKTDQERQDGGGGGERNLGAERIPCTFYCCCANLYFGLAWTLCAFMNIVSFLPWGSQVINILYYILFENVLPITLFRFFCFFFMMLEPLCLLAWISAIMHKYCFLWKHTGCRGACVCVVKTCQNNLHISEQALQIPPVSFVHWHTVAGLGKLTTIPQRALHHSSQD